MIRRRWPGRDRGSFTAEFAAGLPALILMLLVGLTAVRAVTTQLQCLDAAREGAMAAARGDSGRAAAARVAPPGATVFVSTGTETATATVDSSVPLLGGHLPLITVRATAVAAREPDVPGAVE